MSKRKWWLESLLLVVAGLLSANGAEAGLISGQPARDLFEAAVTGSGYAKVTFAYPSGTYLTTQIAGLSFATIRNYNGTPTSAPVYVSGFSGRTQTIVGTPCSGGCSDDGRYAYQVVFTTPQRAAGVQRNWNQWSRTRFYAPDGSLLGEGAGSGYFCFFADGAGDSASFVKRIEFDGVRDPSANTIQVGYSDDLIYGLGAIPEPGTASLLAAGLSGVAALRRRRA